MNPNDTQLYRKEGQSQVVDSQGNLQTFGGDLTTLPIYKQSAITPADLEQQTPIKLPETPQITSNIPAPVDYDSMLGLSDFQKQALQIPEQGLSEVIKSLGVLEGEAQDLQTERQKQGLEEKYKSAQATKARILSLDAEIQQDDIQLAQKLRAEERRDTLLPFAQMGQAKIAGDAAIYRALKTAEKNTLISQQLAQQGEIALAEQFAQDAVDAKYAPHKQRVESFKTILEIIKPTLTSAENKLLKAQELKIAQAEKAIEEAKQNEKEINKMITEAIPNAPASVIANAKSIADKGGNPMDVAIALGQYSGEYLQTKLLKEQIETEKAQRSKIWADINKLNAEMEATTGTTYDPKATEKSLTQLSFLKDQANKAIELSGKAGNTGILSKGYRFIAGATDYTRLEAVSNTLRTNVLTLMTDPEIKKFFGPQMSEADVRLMTAGGTTLNPELQTPEDLKEEVNRLLDLFTRMEDSIKQNSPEYQYINQLTENIDITGTALTPSKGNYINSFNLEN